MVQAGGSGEETGGVWRACALAMCLALVAALTACATATAAAAASPRASAPEPGTLLRARAIRVQTDARYRRVAGLAVTEASSTSVIESFTLATSDLLGARTVPAANGIWFAVCPVGATCPYPAHRQARSPADIAPRRIALELAVRTFLETSADVVAVSLPTQRFTAFVVEREELLHEVDFVGLARGLRSTSHTVTVRVNAIVDRITKPRVFACLGLDITAGGRATWLGVPLWPTGVSP